MVSSSFKSLKVFRVHSPGKAKKKSFWLLANDLTEARIMAQLQAFIGVESISPVSAFLASMVKLANRLPKEVDFAAIFEKIAKMLSVGFSMEKSLLLQLKLLENPYTRYVLAKILKSLKGGQKLGVAMGSIPGIFSEATLAMIAQAEASNGLTEVLVQIGEHQRMASKILRRTASEMIYPCFVAFAGLVVSIGLGFFFLPTLEIIYESFGAKLPSLTHFFVQCVKGFKSFPVLFVIPATLAVLLVVNVNRILKSVRFRSFLDFLPGIGGFLWKRDLLLSFQFLALLLRSGLPMAEALKTLVRSTHNRELQSAFASVLKRLAVGQDVSMSFFEESFRFRKDGEEIANIVEIGDKTGDLDGVLMGLVRNRTEDLSIDLENFGKILKPTLTVGITGFVALIVFVVILPLTQLATVFIQNAH